MQLNENILKKIKENDPSLRVLSLRNGGIKSAAELHTLAEALKSNDVLLALDLRGNQIDDAGVEFLLSGLQNNRILWKLDLSDNQISDRGAQALVKLLSGGMRNLAELRLEKNKIGNVGAQGFVGFLKNNRILTKFNLESNNTNGDIGEDFLNVLEDNHTVTDLSLADWGFKDGIREKIEDLLNRNRRLCEDCHDAMQREEWAIVEDLLGKGVSLLSTAIATENVEHAGNTLLHWAVLTDNSTLVSRLINQMQQAELPLTCENLNGRTAGKLAQGTLLAVLFPDTSENAEINKFQIAYPAIKFTSFLEEGMSGKVFKGEFDGKDVAIKQLLVHKGWERDDSEDFCHEVKVMASLKHPHIVSFLGFAMQEKNYTIVMEYVPQGTLYDLLSNPAEALPWPVRINISFGIGSGLAYLHQRDTFHRDLKSMNVLMGNNYHAKLADFGSVNFKNGLLNPVNESHTRLSGTLLWLPPERGSGEYIVGDETTDIYSLGVVLWEIAARKVPSLEMEQVAAGKREKIPSETPSGYAKLIGKCWQQRAKDRPTTAEVVDELKKLQTSDLSSTGCNLM